MNFKSQLLALLAAVEYGYRECEKGHNLQVVLEKTKRLWYLDQTEQLWNLDLKEPVKIVRCKNCKQPIRLATEKELKETGIKGPDWIHIGKHGWWSCSVASRVTDGFAEPETQPIFGNLVRR